VYRTRSGVAVTARASGAGSATVNGTDDDFDGLIARAAEAIYSRTQPYRYAVYLSRRNRRGEAHDVFVRLSQESPDVRDRAWANIGLGTHEALNGNIYGAVAGMRRSVAISPELVLGWSDIIEYEADLGHDEAAFEAGRRTLALFDAGDVADLRADIQPMIKASDRAYDAAFRGDYAASISVLLALPFESDFSDGNELTLLQIADGYARMHERKKSLDFLRTFPGRNHPVIKANVEIEQAIADAAAEDWHATIVDAGNVDRAVAAAGPIAGLDGNAVGVLRDREVRPIAALAYAETGDFARADALIGGTALDCALCLRMRGNIEALEGRPDAAQAWYARAISAAPSLPSAYADWGRMLLRNDRYDAAVAEFKLAHDRGPRFADPLEMWGEALMQENRSDLALAKFEEADQYAPNWGRLHIKWGQALAWAGKLADSKKQIAIAEGLDLTPEDKVLLAKWIRAHG